MWNDFLTVLAVFLGVVFLIGSVDDLFIDLCHWIGGLKPRKIPLEAWRKWKDQPERPIAVMIPAWKEASVLESMVRTNLSRIQYDNYKWYIGVYPNDIETVEIAQALEKAYPSKVQVVVTDRPGPTSKAHCLNCIIRVIDESAQRARAEGVKSKQFVPHFVAIHDAEDVIHPDSFTAVNAQGGHLDFVQIPIFSLPVSAKLWVAGTYLDEFSEIHMKEIPVREMLNMPIPSAGVGTFFSWKILSVLEKRFGYCFNENNLTEDYEISQRIARLGGLQTFLLIRDQNGQILATREYFPDAMGRSVRQKVRWTTGIALQTLNQWGWFGPSKTPGYYFKNIAAAYGLFRDRKSLWANPAALAAWTLLFVVVASGAKISNHPWVHLLLLVNLVLFALRMVQRARFTNMVYGKVHG
ncbi:MAG: glycosyltransferase, partial [Bdellovibrio sp.]|nr:glycosyltransferase [Bdellovibrio sp.]